ncbi:MAG TPA: hypothetical protein VIZ43_14710 [Trebonia sp.]
MLPSGHGMSTTSALGTSTRYGQRCCSASIAMPKVSESTQASSCPPGLSTRVTSVTRFSAASRREKVRASAITPSAQASGRKESPVPSAVTVDSRAPSAGGAVGGGTCAPASMTRSTLCPAAAATSAVCASGPDMSMRNPLSPGNQPVSWARATAA